MNAFRLFRKYFLNRRPASGPTRQTDFDIYLEPVDYGEYLSALQVRATSSTAIATVTYEGSQYDVLQLDINPDAKNHLLVFAGVHGNEFAASLSVIDLLDDTKQRPGSYASCHIRIITPLNPVGLVHQSRFNESGHDINRDFKDFTTIGGRLQRKVIEDFEPDFLITLHEGPQDGFFLIAESTVPRNLQSKLIAALKSENIRLATKSFLRIGITTGYWRKTPAIYMLQKLLGIHTLGRFTRPRQIPQLTTETPWKSHDVTARRIPHVITVRTVAQSL